MIFGETILSIIKKSISYTGGSKRCNLCLEQKLSILKEKDNCLVNKRSEIVSACQHKNKFQVKSLNKERNACYFNDHTPTFPKFQFMSSIFRWRQRHSKEWIGNAG